MDTWHEHLWLTLAGLRQNWPHALLLHGKKGIGKLQFATQLAHSLLCQKTLPDGHACSDCQSCHWLAQGSHPDFRLIEPESEALEQESDEASEQATGKTSKKKKSRQISIAQIRGLADFVAMSSHQARSPARMSAGTGVSERGGRIILLHPAEALNANASNALLKMLEEPPAGVSFILVSHQRQQLLPTIRSRCQQFAMACPNAALALPWLQSQGLNQDLSQAENLLALAAGAPLLALEMAHLAESHAQLLAQLAKGKRLPVADCVTMALQLGMEQLCSLLQKWLYDIMSFRLAGEARYFPSANQTLQALANTLDLPAMLRYQQQLLLASKSATHPLNAELQMEHLLMGYIQIFTVSGR